MRKFILHPFSKINLSLKVIGKRWDGYHDIVTVFQTVDLTESILVEISGEETAIECASDEIPSGKENIVAKAILLLKKEGYNIPGMKMILKKAIPVGAGLGGGSSDAGAILLGMNRWFNLRMSARMMRDYASRLGSDVPFFLWGGTATGCGRGDDIIPLPALPPFWVVIAVFDERMETAGAYSKIDSLLTEEENNNNITGFIYSIFKGKPDFSLAENDFEKLYGERRGAIWSLKRLFKKRGARVALLTGSGSAYYGLFQEREAAESSVVMARRLGICGDIILCRTVDSGMYHRRLFSQTNQ